MNRRVQNESLTRKDFDEILEKSDRRYYEYLASIEARIAADREKSEKVWERTEARIATDREKSEKVWEQTEARIATDREQTEARISADREQFEARIAADREQTEARIAADRKEAAERLAIDREKSEKITQEAYVRLELERKESARRHRSHTLLLVATFVTVLLGLIGNLWSNGHLPL